MAKLSEKALWEMIKRKLEAQGIELENLLEIVAKVDESDVAVMCATTVDDLSASLAELSDSNRDQVVMVRVDAETMEKLSMWAETGAVKSKSEAAALFIREGLKLRARELEDLSDAIEAVNRAKRDLHSRAKRILGDKEKA